MPKNLSDNRSLKVAANCIHGKLRLFHQVPDRFRRTFGNPKPEFASVFETAVAADVAEQTAAAVAARNYVVDSAAVVDIDSAAGNASGEFENSDYSAAVDFDYRAVENFAAETEFDCLNLSDFDCLATVRCSSPRRNSCRILNR